MMFHTNDERKDVLSVIRFFTLCRLSDESHIFPLVEVLDICCFTAEVW
ncbi:Uncharacterised protein [Porphyromonas cangingivalis]|uniref:Uncharacterized protein n=1 Tax=Porphyromonas cangingivalis TaxID=36874 RepID=A0A1T4MYK4_PORCN|nr:hypothetical protein SAMN02745205_01715 [Porphyromonas cangingivalis]VEJ04190.1 Uncharacterised protein [Porphyromonas cangingivalis]